MFVSEIKCPAKDTVVTVDLECKMLTWLTNFWGLYRILVKDCRNYPECPNLSLMSKLWSNCNQIFPFCCHESVFLFLTSPLTHKSWISSCASRSAGRFVLAVFFSEIFSLNSLSVPYNGWAFLFIVTIESMTVANSLGFPLVKAIPSPFTPQTSKSL